MPPRSRLLGWYLMVPCSSLAADAKSKLATYTNQAYGFSFRYPSDWTLKEGEPVELSWGYLGQVESSMPHGTTVAAVVAPHEPDNGDNFAPYFLSVSIDSGLAADACGRFAPNGPYDVPPQPGTPPIVKLGSISFAQAADDDGGLGHQRYARYYRVFRNRTCYEIEIGFVAPRTSKQKTKILRPNKVTRAGMGKHCQAIRADSCLNLLQRDTMRL